MCSLFGLLDITPVDALFQHDSRGLDLGEGGQCAVANPEEDEHEHDAEEAVGSKPLVNASVGVVDAGLSVGDQ